MKLASILLACILYFSCGKLFSQELEPRALANVPVGLNFTALGYGYTGGNVLLDPAVPIEDLNSNIHVLLGAYVRAIQFFDMPAKVTLVVPFAHGNWTGRITSIDTSTTRTGMGDPLVQFSFNFIGDKASKSRIPFEVQKKTTVGMTFRAGIPLGQYNSEKLINLGANRWMFRPQIGVAHKFRKWIGEFYFSTWFYQQNTNFWGGNTLKINPLHAVKIHLIRSFKKGTWASFDIGYGSGGNSTVNDIKKDAQISTFRLGVVFVKPLALQHSIKIAAMTTFRQKKGPDYDAFGITYQYLWLKKKSIKKDL